MQPSEYDTVLESFPKTLKIEAILKALMRQPRGPTKIAKLIAGKMSWSDVRQLAALAGITDQIFPSAKSRKPLASPPLPT